MPRTYLNELREDFDKPMQFSGRLQSMFEGAGIQPYCLAYARLMCIDYTPSVQGERSFNWALTNMPCFVAADDRLQFGWQEKHLIRGSGVHLFEYEHLILAACLAETLPEDYCAAVLRCLGTRWEDGDRVNPSHSAFKGLIHGLNGAITNTDFGLMVDDRIRLNPYRNISGHAFEGVSSLVPPQDFASAVDLLGQAAGGKHNEITLIGDDILGWFAAGAEFVLGVSVSITDESGRQLYSWQGENKAKLNLIFTERRDALLEQRAATDNTTRLLLPASTEAGKSTMWVPYAGRLTWNALLPIVFEHSFQRLAHQQSKLFGTTLGAVARFFEIFVREDNRFIMSESEKNNPSLFGMGFIQNLCTWFPDLRHLQARMERQLKGSRDETLRLCNDGARDLRSACGCDFCWIDETTARRVQGTNDFCLLGMMETIIELCIAMSRLVVTAKVYPSRAGVLSIYNDHCQNMVKARTLSGHARHALIFSMTQATNARRLQVAATIFSGSWPEIPPENAVALAHEGICAYLLKLQRNEDRWEDDPDANTIRITTGSLAWKTKCYSMGCLGSVDNQHSPLQWDDLKPAHLKQSLFCR